MSYIGLFDSTASIEPGPSYQNDRPGHFQAFNIKHNEYFSSSRLDSSFCSIAPSQVVEGTVHSRAYGCPQAVSKKKEDKLYLPSNSVLAPFPLHCRYLHSTFLASCNIAIFQSTNVSFSLALVGQLTLRHPKPEVGT